MLLQQTETALPWKSRRLCKRSEFQFIQGRGRRFYSSTLAISCCLRRHGCSRLGIVVTKKYGSAVQRNLFKRRIRALFASYSHLLDIHQSGYDFVIKAQNNTAEAPWCLLQEEFITLIHHVANQPPRQYQSKDHRHHKQQSAKKIEKE